MLEVPETERKGTEIEELGKSPPCFRCLFEKPLSEFWCRPETCDMLEFWLFGPAQFRWEEHVSMWIITINLKVIRNIESSEESLV